MDHETDSINQIIEEIKELDEFDPHAPLLADALNDFFHELEEIPASEVLNDDEII